MARLGRLELPTYGFEVRRSIQLSYRRKTLRYFPIIPAGGHFVIRLLRSF